MISSRKRLHGMKKRILFFTISIIMTTTISTQNISADQANEQLKYFTDQVNIPSGYKILSIAAIQADQTEAYCFRYAKGTNTKLGGEHFSFIVTQNAPYKILGFTFMDVKYVDNDQLNKEQTEKIATDFLKAIDPMFFEQLQLQWIDIHDEQIDINGQKETVRGMKCKYYRPSHKDYAWIIVGYDGSIVTFERDILWSNGMQKRITEKWLHDSWLSELK